jgi:hypothetical protein
MSAQALQAYNPAIVHVQATLVAQTIQTKIAQFQTVLQSEAAPGNIHDCWFCTGLPVLR